MKHEIRQGDSLEQLKLMESETVDCIVTSPPYFGLRDYGTGEWEGGDPNCDHVANKNATKKMGNPEYNKNRPSREDTITPGYYEDVCPKCGAVRKDKQIGLEPTPQEYIDRLKEVFHEAKRVLKPEGTLWLNIGDSYCASKTGSSGTASTLGGKKRGDSNKDRTQEEASKRPDKKPHGDIKTKDLIGIPWMLAFALREDGWYLRQDIIWNKNNPMPESVTDRCTNSHEYIFFLTKSPRYFFDNTKIKEPCVSTSPAGNKSSMNKGRLGREGWDFDAEKSIPKEGRNKRDVWHINTKPYKEAHFAVFPEELVEPCILAGCPQNGLVMDIFCGSGTVGAVCVKHERDFIGIELNPEYIKLAEKRIDKAKAEGTQLNMEEML